MKTTLSLLEGEQYYYYARNIRRKLELKLDCYGSENFEEKVRR